MKQVFVFVMILSLLVVVVNKLQGDGTTIAKEVMRIHKGIENKGRAPAVVNWK
jgi:hypothetical protein